MRAHVRRLQLAAACVDERLCQLVCVSNESCGRLPLRPQALPPCPEQGCRQLPVVFGVGHGAKGVVTWRRAAEVAAGCRCGGGARPLRGRLHGALHSITVATARAQRGVHWSP